jgi:hypothetical protein
MLRPATIAQDRLHRSIHRGEVQYLDSRLRGNDDLGGDKFADIGTIATNNRKFRFIVPLAE